MYCEDAVAGALLSEREDDPGDDPRRFSSRSPFNYTAPQMFKSTSSNLGEVSLLYTLLNQFLAQSAILPTVLLTILPDITLLNQFLGSIRYLAYCIAAPEIRSDLILRQVRVRVLSRQLSVLAQPDRYRHVIVRLFKFSNAIDGGQYASQSARLFIFALQLPQPANISHAAPTCNP